LRIKTLGFRGGRWGEKRICDSISQFTALPVHAISTQIDDAEREDGRINLDTMLVDSGSAIQPIVILHNARIME